MGQLETRLKKQERLGKVSKVLLSLIGAAGLVTVAVLAPNALQVLGYVNKDRRQTKSPKTRLITQATKRLSQRGLVRIVEINGRREISVTPKGTRLLELLGGGHLKKRNPTHWDGKWRMVIFDIPEVRHRTRDKLRYMLIRIGFVRVQGSVWVYPYDCEDLILLLKTDARIAKHVLYAVVSVMEGEGALLRQFGLSR